MLQNGFNSSLRRKKVISNVAYEFCYENKNCTGFQPRESCTYIRKQIILSALSLVDYISSLSLRISDDDGIIKKLTATDELMSCDPAYLSRVGKERAPRLDFDDYDPVPQKFSM
ncbi:hypothetical protein AgCh_013792 [Apium graveolens]